MWTCVWDVSCVPRALAHVRAVRFPRARCAGFFPDVHGRSRVGADRMSYRIVLSLEVARSAGKTRRLLPRVGPPRAVCAAARPSAARCSRRLSGAPMVGRPVRRPRDVSREAGAPGVSPPRRVPQDRKSVVWCRATPRAGCVRTRYMVASCVRQAGAGNSYVFPSPRFDVILFIEEVADGCRVSLFQANEAAAAFARMMVRSVLLPSTAATSSAWSSDRVRVPASSACATIRRWSLEGMS